MYLSKFLIVLLCAIALSACGSTPANQNSAAAGTANQQTNSQYPFSVKEPEVYQGDFYAGSSEYKNHWFVARKDGKWRIDFFKDNALDWSQLKTDKVYYINHKRKIYSAEPYADKNAVDSPYFSTLLSGFFKGKEYKKFEDLGTDGNLKKYKVHSDDSGQNDVVLYVDPSTNMVVKQELNAHNEMDGKASTVSYTYEIKNLKLDVAEEVLALPADYKEVEWNQFAPYAPAEAK